MLMPAHKQMTVSRVTSAARNWSFPVLVKKIEEGEKKANYKG